MCINIIMVLTSRLIKYLKIIAIVSCSITVIMGLILRCSFLTLTPPGFYIDEASIAENAFQLIKTGNDEWGVRLPLYFRAFGEYKNPIFIYSVTAVFRLFGTSVYSTRLTAALWGILTVLALSFLAFKIGNHLIWGLITAFITVFMPWHFHISRVAFEAISMPFFMSLFILGLWHIHHRWSYKWGLFTVIANGIMFYSYTSARLISILHVLLLCVYCWPRIKWKVIFIPLLTFLILIPAVLWEQRFPGSLIVRFKETGINLFSPNSYKEIIHNYWGQFNSDMWLFKGDSNLRHTPEVGLLPKPFLVAAMAFLFTLRKQRFSRMLMCLLITAPAAASLTQSGPHSLRIIHAIPVIITIIIVGLVYLWQHRDLGKYLVAVSLIIFTWESSFFISNYFYHYSGTARWKFEAPYTNSLPLILHQPNPLIIHHPLLGSNHYVTAKNYQHMNDLEFIPDVNFDNDTSSLSEGYINVYFDQDCFTLKSQKSNTFFQNSELCLMVAE